MSVPLATMYLRSKRQERKKKAMTTITSTEGTIKVQVIGQGNVLPEQRLLALKRRMERKNVRVK